MATAIILRQETDQYDFTNPGSPVLGTTIFYQTGAGNTGSVFIPQTRYSIKEVHKVVAAAAALLDEVGALQVNY